MIRRLPEAKPAERRALREAERQRAESIYAWDRQLGGIVDRLKATGEYESTVLMFTSDNGFFVGEHRQRLGKIKSYEPSLRVPFAVAGPGIGQGVRYTPITTVDLAETVLELGGAQPLPGTDGTSKVAALLGPDLGWDTAVVTEGLLKNVRRARGSGFPRGLTTSGLRTGRYKLILYANGEGELYDLARDPLELTSRWRDPSYAAVRRQLVEAWLRYRSCRGAGCRVPLPAELRTVVAGLASLDQGMRAATTRYYGRPYDALP
jgi:arylsulfatase A-like enzyme